MPHALLIINNEKRNIRGFRYEYFRKIEKSKERYRKILQKNFPYNEVDRYDLFPYESCNLPVLGKSLSDIKLVKEARMTSDSTPYMLTIGETNRKKVYYETLTRLRYNLGLDRLFIPNLHNEYAMEVRPTEIDYPCFYRNVIGGHLILTFESTDNDDFFYNWLFTGKMANGEINIYRSDSDNYFKYSFLDCYCYEIKECMTAYTSIPMQMRICLSPGILINKGLICPKSWKVTDVTPKPFHAAPIAVHYEPRQSEQPPTPVEEPRQPELLITSVEGTETALPKGKVNYKVTGYNRSDVSDADLAKIKWTIIIDGQEYPQSWRGNQVQVQVKEEWIGKEITVFPYLKEKSEKVCVKTEVVKFKKSVLFATSIREPGKNLNGNISEDMTYRDVEARDILDNKLFSDLLKYNENYLFNLMYNLTANGALLKGGENSKKLVDHFKSNTGNIYSNGYMNEQMKKSKTLEEFVYQKDGVLDVLCQILRKTNGNINKIETQVGKIRSTRVKFDTLWDMFNGMSISVHDTIAYKIYVDDYELLSGNTFNCNLHIKIFDHFGLDMSDVEKFSIFDGFKAWYILQHVKGYRPFLTCLECTLEIKNYKIERSYEN